MVIFMLAVSAGCMPAGPSDANSAVQPIASETDVDSGPVPESGPPPERDAGVGDGVDFPDSGYEYSECGPFDAGQDDTGEDDVVDPDAGPGDAGEDDVLS